MTEPVETERRGRGRPTLFSEERAELVLDNLAAGKSWGEVEEIAGVSVRSVMRWADARPGFAAELDAAKRAAAEVCASDNPLRSEADPQRARVRFERNRWLASKWGASVYGDKLSIEVEHKIDLSGALASARARLAVGVAIDAAAPSPARLGVSSSWPMLEDQPSTSDLDFLK